MGPSPSTHISVGVRGEAPLVQVMNHPCSWFRRQTGLTSWTAWHLPTRTSITLSRVIGCRLGATVGGLQRARWAESHNLTRSETLRDRSLSRNCWWFKEKSWSSWKSPKACRLWSQQGYSWHVHLSTVFCCSCGCSLCWKLITRSSGSVSTIGIFRNTQNSWPMLKVILWYYLQVRSFVSPTQGVEGKDL